MTNNLVVIDMGTVAEKPWPFREKKIKPGDRGVTERQLWGLEGL